MQQNQKIAEDRGGLGLPGHRFVDEHHESGDSGIEVQRVEVFGHFLDAGVEGFQFGVSRVNVFDSGTQLDLFEGFCAAFRLGGRVLLEFGLAFFIDEQSPYAAEKTVNAFHAFGAPGLHHLQRPHEHFIKPQRIGPEFVNHFVRIHDVSARLGHLLAILTED